VRLEEEGTIEEVEGTWRELEVVNATEGQEGGEPQTGETRSEELEEIESEGAEGKTSGEGIEERSNECGGGS